MNVKVFNLASYVIERRFLVHHKSCKCKCRLYEIARKNHRKNEIKTNFDFSVRWKK